MWVLYVIFIFVSEEFGEVLLVVKLVLEVLVGMGNFELFSVVC